VGMSSNHHLVETLAWGAVAVAGVFVARHLWKKRNR
jgi:hypothetical protein